MWNFIKQWLRDYNETQIELNKLGIHFIPNWHGLIFYVDPEIQENYDRSKTISKND